VGCDQEMRDREEVQDEALKLGYVIQRVQVPSGKRARAAGSEPCATAVMSVAIRRCASERAAWSQPRKGYSRGPSRFPRRRRQQQLGQRSGGSSSPRRGV
jgi:hypothetical protein